MWLQDFVNYVDNMGEVKDALCPSVQDLKDLIENNNDVCILANRMWDEIPMTKSRDKNPTAQKLVRDYKHMLQLLSVIVTEITPAWSTAGLASGLIGAPFASVLQWAMGTVSGFSFFLRSDVNEKFRIMMNVWRDDILMTSKSQNVLTTKENGWLSKDAMEVLVRESNQSDQPWLPFEEIFQCDRAGDPVHWGFTSWDSFFVRGFKNINKLRPVAYPNDPEWIVNPCEARPYAIKTDVKESDRFWIKGQIYSLSHMMDNHIFTSNFVGGTVYQSFLSPFSYHRWTSPVAGKVVYSKVVNGTYFSEPISDIYEGPKDYDLWPSDRAQAYLSHAATRAILFIKAPEPVGLMCLIPIGMADVSSCDIAEKFSSNLPQSVEKGEELGMFHHGGSSYAMVFRKGVKLDFIPEAFPVQNPTNRPVRGAVARASAI